MCSSGKLPAGELWKVAKGMSVKKEKSTLPYSWNGVADRGR